EVTGSFHVQQDMAEWSSLMGQGVLLSSMDKETWLKTYGPLHPGGGNLEEYGADVDCMVCHEQKGLYDYQARVESISSGNIAGAKEAAISEASKEAQKEPLYVASYMLNILTPLPIVTEIHDEVNAGPTKEQCGTTCHQNEAATSAVTWMAANSNDYDVHANVNCVECHETDEHQIGRRVPLDSTHYNYVEVKSCDSEGCHAGISHGDIVDSHLETLECETCHITMLPGGNLTGVTPVSGFSWENGVLEEAYHESDFTPTLAWSAGLYNGKLPVMANKDTEGVKLNTFNVITGVWWDEGQNQDVLNDPDNSSSLGDPIPPSAVKSADSNGDGKVTSSEIRSYDGNLDNQPDYPNAVLRNVDLLYQVSHNVASTDVGMADPLKCADCHGTSEALHIDWGFLGYEKDPAGTTTPTQEISVTIPGQKPTEVEREPAL
ncbi:methanogenesis multiheme c-type cytochrome, partial [Methanomethylovorans sp.]|uniref:methanogenesis multiheme c-type cytochrome n=1 Tax=Methanomethylovorans sp. TaxID=2758717 RepID=UPI00351C23B3